MIETNRKVKYLSEKDVRELLDKCKNVKYKFAAAVMLFTGCRVSEMCNLKIRDIDFQKREISIITLKQHRKEGKAPVEKRRTVPLTDELMRIAVEYYPQIKDRNPDAYVFPSPSIKGQHICREVFWRYYQKVTDGRVYNHVMRHTFGSKLAANQTDIITIKELMGHTNIESTMIYLHTDDDRKRLAIENMEYNTPIRKLLKSHFPFLYSPKNTFVLPVQTGWVKFHVGRKKELMKLYELTQKKVNILLLGEYKVGKSALLDNYKGENLLRVDDGKDFTKTLQNMIMQIIGIKPEMIVNEDTGEEIGIKNSKEVLLEMLGANREVITKMSRKRLTEILVKLTTFQEYTIIMDSIDDITPSVVKALEFLNRHFHFIVAARQVKLSLATWLTNFEKIELKPLSREDIMRLTTIAAEEFRQRIKDFEAFQNHIWNKCAGNPGLSLELIERLSKESWIDNRVLGDTEFTTVQNEVDGTPVVMILLICVVAMKFWSREAMPDDRQAFMLFGGIAMIILFIMRYFISSLRRKYI